MSAPEVGSQVWSVASFPLPDGWWLRTSPGEDCQGCRRWVPNGYLLGCVKPGKRCMGCNPDGRVVEPAGWLCLSCIAEEVRYAERVAVPR